MTSQPTSPTRKTKLNPTLKLVLDLGPLLVFFAANSRFGIFAATGAFMVAVLLALVGDPKLIVLDEAFNGLDPASALVLKRHLRTRIERRGGALLLATHSLDIVEHYADRAAVLIDGKLKHEWPKDELQRLRENGNNFEAALAQATAESVASR